MEELEANVAEQNHAYQTAFARALIDTLGVDEAIDVCARNCWAGIQAVIATEYGAAAR